MIVTVIKFKDGTTDAFERVFTLFRKGGDPEGDAWVAQRAPGFKLHWLKPEEIESVHNFEAEGA